MALRAICKINHYYPTFPLFQFLSLGLLSVYSSSECLLLDGLPVAFLIECLVAVEAKRKKWKPKTPISMVASVFLMLDASGTCIETPETTQVQARFLIVTSCAECLR